MSEKQADPQDGLIRALLIGGVSFVILGFLVTCVVVTVLLSMNFNILNWME